MRDIAVAGVSRYRFFAMIPSASWFKSDVCYSIHMNDMVHLAIYRSNLEYTAIREAKILSSSVVYQKNEGILTALDVGLPTYP